MQEFLKLQGVLTVLVEGRLSTSGNKVQVYFDNTSKQIRLEGILSKEDFMVRALVYQHFGRI